MLVRIRNRCAVSLASLSKVSFDFSSSLAGPGLFPGDWQVFKNGNEKGKESVRLEDVKRYGYGMGMVWYGMTT